MANQLTGETAGSTVKTYGYDANGNNIGIASYNSGVSAGTITMNYDGLNRMTSWQLSRDGDLVSQETHSYRGSEWHRRSTSANGVSTSFLYDGDNVLVDYVTTGGGGSTFDRLYVTPFLDQNLSMTLADGSTYYYSQDGLGSVRTLTDASGNLNNKYDYLAFGETYALGTSVNVAQRYTYTGREQSAYELALMYYRWRMYAPGVGRFVQRDPLGYKHETVDRAMDIQQEIRDLRELVHVALGSMDNDSDLGERLTVLEKLANRRIFQLHKERARLSVHTVEPCVYEYSKNQPHRMKDPFGQYILVDVYSCYLACYLWHNKGHCRNGPENNPTLHACYAWCDSKLSLW